MISNWVVFLAEAGPFSGDAVPTLVRAGRETIDEQVDQPRAEFMVNGSQHLTASAGAGRESHQVLSSVGRLTRKAGEWMLMLGLATGVRRARSYVWIIQGGRRLAVVSRRW